MQLKNDIEQIEILRDYPMSKLTTFRIGGPAKEVYLPRNNQEIVSLVNHFNKANLKYMVLGNGSNILVRDSGIDFPIIKIDSKLSDCYFEGDTLVAEAGILLSKLSMFAASNGFSGLEFASGIPGTLGGAIYMNAGAYGGEIKDIIVSVDILDNSGNLKTLSGDEMLFGYRGSYIKKNGGIVLSARIKLDKAEKSAIMNRINKLTEKRVSKQPLELPSAGSVFKRPEGNYAGHLIDISGLKGFRIGGAMVSEKHAGFIVNVGGATANDVMALIDHIRETVNSKHGILLEPEVCIIPK